MNDGHDGPAAATRIGLPELTGETAVGVATAQRRLDGIGAQISELVPGSRRRWSIFGGERGLRAREREEREEGDRGAHHRAPL
jgi:hypothetical protein